MFTPVDIENKEFKKSLRGYDVYEVEEFLKTLVMDYEKLYRDNANYKEKNVLLQETIAGYKGMEETMQNAIIVAQRTSEDIKKNAYERAENIVKEAQLRANETLSQADKAITDLEKKYMALKGEMETFRARMRAMLTTYMELLSDADKENVGYHTSVFAQQPRYDVSGYAQEEKQGAVQNMPASDEYFQTKTDVNPVIEDLLMQKKPQPEPQTFAEEPKAPFDIKKQTFDTSDKFTANEVVVNVSAEKDAHTKEVYFDVFKDNSL